MDCGGYRKKFTVYLERALGGAEAVEMWDHLESCADCREAFKAEQAFVRLLQENLKPSPAPPELVGKVRSLVLAKSSRGGSLTAWFPWATAAVGAALLLLGWFFFAAPRTDLSWAADAHGAASAPGAALEVESADPAELSRWFSAQAAPDPGLPDAKSFGLTLRGGRVLHLSGETVAQLVFDGGGETTSLFVLPRGEFRLGGPSVDFGGLRFYPRKVGDYHLTAWAAPSVRYLLVSKTAEATDRGCRLCHGSGKIEIPLQDYFQRIAGIDRL